MDVLPSKGGKIGGVKKEYVYSGIAVAVVTLAVVYYRSKSTDNGVNSTGTVTDPAGNVCAALSPSSGYCPGSPEDLAYAGNTATGSGGLVGSDSSSFVGGQIIGYDQYGNPIYSGGPTQSGPGSYTNNAQWTQAASASLIDADQNTNAETINEALGNYINGRPVTAAQRSIIQQAIAFQGYPPVGGPNGNPPGIVDSTATPPTIKNVTHKPGGLRAVNITTKSATLQCTSLQNATSYHWRVWEANAAHHVVFDKTSPTTSIPVTGLKPKTSYGWHVAGSANGKDGLFSYTSHFTTPKLAVPVKHKLPTGPIVHPGVANA
jgi:hypothetical protein